MPKLFPAHVAVVLAPVHLKAYALAFKEISSRRGDSARLLLSAN